MGGVFNYVNLHVYHYAGNNPVVLSDPDGFYFLKQSEWYNDFYQNDLPWNGDPLGEEDVAYTLGSHGCVVVAGTRAIVTILNFVARGRLEGGVIRLMPNEINKIDELVTRNGFMTSAVASFLKKEYGITVHVSRYSGKKNIADALDEMNRSDSAYVGYIKIRKGAHTISLESVEGDRVVGFETYRDGSRGKIVTMNISEIHELISIKIDEINFE
jgi:hypothetical protein